MVMIMVMITEVSLVSIWDKFAMPPISNDNNEYLEFKNIKNNTFKLYWINTKQRLRLFQIYLLSLRLQESCLSENRLSKNTLHRVIYSGELAILIDTCILVIFIKLLSVYHQLKQLKKLWQ